MTRFDIINTFIQKYNYNSYLEIGIQNRSKCFDQVKCSSKTCVDPDPNAKADFILTSDDFFVQNKEVFDLIFIDGMHVREYVHRDIINSLQILKSGGMIICHDINPKKYEEQLAERITKRWNGNCWEAFVQLRQERGDLLMFTVDTDEGCGVICLGEQKTISKDLVLTYENLDKNRKEWLNLISVEEFKKLI